MSSEVSTRRAKAALDESRLVPPPRAIRKLAVIVGLILLALPVVLFFAPWRQNIPASGRVVALDPLDRLQSIPSPVSGRLVTLHVQEGSVVAKGDPLVELADLDPEYVSRLRLQLDLALQKSSAARDSVDFYSRQLELLDLERAQAIEVARAELAVAEDKVRAEEQELLSARAEREQKIADRTRREALHERELVSELDLQKAVAAAIGAEAKVSIAEAKLEQARSDRRAKQAKIEQVASSAQAKIESTRSTREEARSKLATAEKERTEAETKLRRQSTQVVTAPRDGVVLRIHGAARADLVKAGDPLIDFVPSTRHVAVELWVRGNDAPLISKDREVRIQFEGWPAVQFAGWPSVAVGTFGGRVHVVDSQDDGGGRFRVLVVPDESDEPWPDLFFTRQGTRANGWVLLEEVSLAYELWRQLNAFPPSLRNGPLGASAKKSSGDRGGIEKDGADAK